MKLETRRIEDTETLYGPPDKTRQPLVAGPWRSRKQPNPMSCSLISLRIPAQAETPVSCEGGRLAARRSYAD